MNLFSLSHLCSAAARLPKADGKNSADTVFPEVNLLTRLDIHGMMHLIPKKEESAVKKTRQNKLMCICMHSCGERPCSSCACPG